MDRHGLHPSQQKFLNHLGALNFKLLRWAWFFFALDCWFVPDGEFSSFFALDCKFRGQFVQIANSVVSLPSNAISVVDLFQIANSVSFYSRLRILIVDGGACCPVFCGLDLPAHFSFFRKGAGRHSVCNGLDLPANYSFAMGWIYQHVIFSRIFQSDVLNLLTRQILCTCRWPIPLQERPRHWHLQHKSSRLSEKAPLQCSNKQQIAQQEILRHQWWCLFFQSWSSCSSCSSQGACTCTNSVWGRSLTELIIPVLDGEGGTSVVEFLITIDITDCRCMISYTISWSRIYNIVYDIVGLWHHKFLISWIQDHDIIDSLSRYHTWYHGLKSMILSILQSMIS
jgi:hypothetical protein